MIRSTQAQKAARLRAAQRLLANKIGMAEAALALSRESGLSLRQAYRYLEEARKKEPLLPAPQPSVTISLKMPANLAPKRPTACGGFQSDGKRGDAAGGDGIS